MTALSELATLNPAQREAVLHGGAPLLILAGAGSGKTRVITMKIAHLIRERGADPRSILAVTFTNKAANEMRERAAALAPGASDVLVRTFHSFGAWLLRRNAAAAGLSAGYSIYDEDDSLSLLKSLHPDEHRGTLSRYARLISRAKDYCLSPYDDLDAASPDPLLPEIYRRYQGRLEEIGNVDFGDLIRLPVELLRREPAIRRRVRQRFRYVLVDEYQDSNVAQHELLKQLTDETTYLCVVGDDDQSIYRFRGAEVRNILTFAESFPGTEVIRLEQNYRSTGSILEVASAVVSRNTGRLGKTLWTRRPTGPRPAVAVLGDQEQEVEYCLRLIRESPCETAILYRINAQSRPFETAFLRAGVPYRIVGALRFYEREEVKDALALLKLAANPRDEVSFRRVVNKPSRGVGAKSVDRVVAGIGETEGDLLRAAARRAESLSAKAAGGLRAFLGVIESARSALGSGSLADFTERLLKDALIWEHHATAHDELTARGKVENLEELVNAARLYPATTEGLAEFLELVELDRSRELGEEVEAQVTLITMHNTKGLEFDRVIVTGLEEGLFPRGAGEEPEDLEEERRLFYVAVTRARNELHLTCCSYRRLHGRTADSPPSRFLREIPRDLIRADRALGEARGPADGEYPRGVRIYHDDYGAGVVTGSWTTGTELVVQVQFETGRVARFLPRYTPLERVHGDD